MAESKEPLQLDPFGPRLSLRNRHAMTLAGNFLPRKDNLPQAEEELFEVEEDIQGMCHCHWQPDAERCGTAIIVHGLEGSSGSQYVIGTPNKPGQPGMKVIRINSHNGGGAEEHTPTLDHCVTPGDWA